MSFGGCRRRRRPGAGRTAVPRRRRPYPLLTHYEEPDDLGGRGARRGDLVGPAAGDGEPLGHGAGRVASRRPRGQLGPHGVPDGVVVGRPLGRRPLDDQHDLARWLTLGRPGGGVGQRAAPHLLVQLGQLAGDRHPAVGTAGGGEVGQRAGDPVRRLVQHRGAGLGRHRGQALGARRALAGQEPLEHEPARRQAADHEAGQRGRRPGHHLDDVPLGHRRRHQALAGVGHARHPRVGHQRHPLTPGQPGQQTRDLPRPRCAR